MHVAVTGDVSAQVGGGGFGAGIVTVGVDGFALGGRVVDDPVFRRRAGVDKGVEARGEAGFNEVAGGGDIGAKNSYEVGFNPMYNGIAPSFPDIQELAAAHTKPWDEIIRVPTIEDQVKMLCGCIPASAITYALGDVYRDMIPQHIWDQSRAQTQTNSTPFANAQASAPAAANPMAQSQPANPMGQAPANPVAYEPPAAPPQAAAPAANPMAAPPQAAPPAEPVQTTVAPPQAAAPAAPPQEFDPQPTTAEPSRAADTMGAIERARQRVAKAAGGS